MPKRPVADAPAKLELYHPYGAAVELWKCKDPEVLIEGPAGTGKSLAMWHKVNALCFKYPGIRVLVVRKWRASMSESVLVTLEDKVFKDHPAYPEFRNTQRRLRQEYKYPNGSMIVVRGMDNADAVMSTDFDVFVAFEATELTEGDWEQGTTRLRNMRMPYQQALADCNPDRPSHWLNVRASKAYEIPKGMEQYFPPPRPGQTQMTRLLSRHQDNPTLFDHKAGVWRPEGAQYIAKLMRLSGARYHRLFEGRWAASEGMVYPGFDPSVHVVNPFEIPRDWRRVRSIDFGFTNPFVCLWFAVDPDGRMYLYRELYRTQAVVEDHAKAIVKLSGGERYEATVADHDAEDRATLVRHGVKTTRAWKSVMPGIEAVTMRLRKAGDDRPRLMIFRDALVERDPLLVEAGLPTGLLQEFDSYVYPKAGDGKSAKEEPVKLHDHSLDALRYAVAYVDDLAKRRFKIRGGRVRGVGQLAGAR
jgi:PBSX family phage terminase large subunit